MWRAMAWMCSLAALSCNTLPDKGVIQTAYDREESAGSKLHDKNLQVLSAKCHDSKTDRFLCEVTFVSTIDPNQRLYFDIVAVAHVGNHWELESGLCKH
ncbi:MAG TPA: hypothetical protein VGF36_08085 [Rhodopila sp.]